MYMSMIFLFYLSEIQFGNDSTSVLYERITNPQLISFIWIHLLHEIINGALFQDDCLKSNTFIAFYLDYFYKKLNILYTY